MKVFNLTDVSTSALKAVGWVNVPIRVGGQSVAPGTSIEISEKFRPELLKYIRSGALALDTAPKGYVSAESHVPPVPTQPAPSVFESAPEVVAEPELSFEVTSTESSPEGGGGPKRRRRRR